MTGWRAYAATLTVGLFIWLAMSLLVAWLESLAWDDPGPSVSVTEPAPPEVSALIEEARRITREAAEGQP